jgi:hypothetical protein
MLKSHWSLAILLAGSPLLAAPSGDDPFTARTCLNHQLIGAEFASQLLPLSRVEPDACDRYQADMLLFYDAVDSLAADIEDPVENSCWVIGALDSAYKTAEKLAAACRGEAPALDDCTVTEDERGKACQGRLNHDDMFAIRTRMTAATDPASCSHTILKKLQDLSQGVGCE